MSSIRRSTFTGHDPELALYVADAPEVEAIDPAEYDMWAATLTAVRPVVELPTAAEVAAEAKRLGLAKPPF